MIIHGCIGEMWFVENPETAALRYRQKGIVSKALNQISLNLNIENLKDKERKEVFEKTNQKKVTVISTIGRGFKS
jgi:hypothetical protein